MVFTMLAMFFPLFYLANPYSLFKIKANVNSSIRLFQTLSLILIIGKLSTFLMLSTVLNAFNDYLISFTNLQYKSLKYIQL